MKKSKVYGEIEGMELEQVGTIYQALIPGGVDQFGKYAVKLSYETRPNIKQLREDIIGIIEEMLVEENKYNFYFEGSRVILDNDLNFYQIAFEEAQKFGATELPIRVGDNKEVVVITLGKFNEFISSVRSFTYLNTVRAWNRIHEIQEKYKS